jgi:hypothetical protein
MPFVLEGSACDLHFGPPVSATLNDAGTRLILTAGVNNNGEVARRVKIRMRWAGPSNGSTTSELFVVNPGFRGIDFSMGIPPQAPRGTYNLTFELHDVQRQIVCDTNYDTVTLSAPVVGGGTAWEAPPNAELFGTASAVTGVSAVAPNPFAGRTTLSFAVAEATEARLSVYDVLGREVAVLVDGYVEAGTHQATFEARDLAAGTYVYRLVVGGAVQTGRLTLTR